MYACFLWDDDYMLISDMFLARDPTFRVLGRWIVHDFISILFPLVEDYPISHMRGQRRYNNMFKSLGL